jgi:hypothetical protein
MSKHILAAKRRERRLQRLMTLPAVCIACGLPQVEALMDVPFSALPPEFRRRLMEYHHPAGRMVDPDWTVPLCKNCHAILTEVRRLHLPPHPPATPEERATLTIAAGGEVILVSLSALLDAQDRIVRAMQELPPHHPAALGGMLVILLPPLCVCPTAEVWLLFFVVLLVAAAHAGGLP